MRKQKQTVFLQLKKDYVVLKRNWDSNKGYDAWMAQPLNNAHLALAATYHELVPDIKRYIQNSGGDLQLFYKQMEQLSRLPISDRHDMLRSVNGK